MNHYNIVCRECGIRLGGCRCPGPNKTTKLGICKECEVTLERWTQEDEDQVRGNQED